MRSFVTFCFKTIGRVLSFVWPYSVSLKFSLFISKIYTYWAASKLQQLGKSSSLNYPVDFVGGKYIFIGSRVVIGKRGIITAWDRYLRQTFHPTITVGDGTSIGEDCHITAINKIQIGSNVLMGKKITITDNAHGDTNIESLQLPPLTRPLHSKGPVIIEDNVWIGDKVTILANVRIGTNAIIGANALVTKDVPKNCVAGGVPARVIKLIE